jgi:hypothetical protein
MKTTGGKEIYQAKDNGEEWFCPTENPFLHVCCSCGLSHQVTLAFVDSEGNEFDPNDLKYFSVAMKFNLDTVETANVRATKACSVMSDEAKGTVLMLATEVSMELVEKTSFGNIKISELDRDSLLRLVALLAARKESSRIIRV